jgi:hypothetical protein
MQDTLQFNQSLNYRINSRLNMTFSGVQTFNEAEGLVRPRLGFDLEPTTDVDFYSFDLKFNWRPRSSLSIRPTIGVWVRQEDRVPVPAVDFERRFFTTRLDVTWRVRQLFMEFNYYHNVSLITEVNRVEDRVFFRLRRAFR